MFSTMQLMQQQEAPQSDAAKQEEAPAEASASNSEVQEQLAAEGAAPEQGTPVLDQVGEDAAGQAIPQVPVPARSPLTSTMPRTSTNTPFIRQVPSQIKVLELGNDEDQD